MNLEEYFNMMNKLAQKKSPPEHNHHSSSEKKETRRVAEDGDESVAT